MEKVISTINYVRTRTDTARGLYAAGKGVVPRDTVLNWFWFYSQIYAIHSQDPQLAFAYHNKATIAALQAADVQGVIRTSNVSYSFFNFPLPEHLVDLVQDFFETLDKLVYKFRDADTESKLDILTIASIFLSITHITRDLSGRCNEDFLSELSAYLEIPLSFSSDGFRAYTSGLMCEREATSALVKKEFAYFVAIESGLTPEKARRLLESVRTPEELADLYPESEGKNPYDWYQALAKTIYEVILKLHKHLETDDLETAIYAIKHLLPTSYMPLRASLERATHNKYTNLASELPADFCDHLDTIVGRISLLHSKETQANSNFYDLCFHIEDTLNMIDAASILAAELSVEQAALATVILEKLRAILCGAQRILVDTDLQTSHITKLTANAATKPLTLYEEQLAAAFNLHMQGDQQSALYILEKQRSLGKLNAYGYSLLASVYQELGQSEQAAIALNMQGALPVV
jgi:hypothetical protein